VPAARLIEREADASTWPCSIPPARPASNDALISPSEIVRGGRATAWAEAAGVARAPAAATRPTAQACCNRLVRVGLVTIAGCSLRPSSLADRRIW
jgi:hypothetical protein